MIAFSCGDHRARHQRPDHDGAAREALADVVVGVAEHLELQPLHREGAERLAGRAAQAHRDLAGLQPVHAEALVMCAESRVPIARCVLRTL